MNRFKSTKGDSESLFSFFGLEPEKQQEGGPEGRSSEKSYSSLKKEWESEWEQMQQKRRGKKLRPGGEGTTKAPEKPAAKKEEPRLSIWVRNIFIAIAVLSFIFSTLSPMILGWMGEYLVVRDDITQPADFICVCGGGSAERVAYSARLYFDGKAASLLVLGDPVHLPGISATWAELAVREMTERYKVPPGVIISDSRGTSTFEEAVLTRKLFERENVESAIIVSEPFHTRRVKMIFDRVFTGSGIDLRYSATEPSWFKPDDWWGNEKMMIAVFEEYAKTLLYVYWYIFPGVRIESGE